MTTPNASKAIRNWMYSTSFEDISPEVRRFAILAMYDAIGGDLACSMLPVAHRMVDFVNIMGGAPDCSMIGFQERTSALNAALVNGTLGHADEVDPVGGDMGAHIMAATMGAALAVGQLAGASGQEVVRAVILGSELARRVQRVASQARQSGNPPAGPVDAGNTMGAAAAAGIALGLSPDQMDVTLSLAATMACGITPFTREEGHMLKSFVRGGVGAKNGVAAALLAKVGYDAPRDIFDGPQGFFHSRLGVEQPGPEFLSGLGEEYGISQLILKRRCGGGPNQAPSQALLEMMAEHSLSADNIQDMQVEVEPGGFDTMTYVRHSSIHGKTVLALAAVYGGLGFRETHQEACYKSPQVLALAERITVKPQQDWMAHDHYHTVVTINTKDGRTLRKETDYRLMNEVEVDAKFLHLVGLRAGEAKAEELAQIVKRLDTASNIADVMVQLELPQDHIEQK
jgi:2-methylcitrate dehydratase PrpD